VSALGATEYEAKFAREALLDLPADATPEQRSQAERRASAAAEAFSRAVGRHLNGKTR
jgi:hypothetical protein